MNLSPQSILSISSQILSQEVGDDVVLLDLESEGYFSLNGVGMHIWQYLQENQEATISDVESMLFQEFDVEPTQLNNDLLELISDLVERKIIEVN